MGYASCLENNIERQLDARFMYPVYASVLAPKSVEWKPPLFVAPPLQSQQPRPAESPEQRYRRLLEVNILAMAELTGRSLSLR
jgi:hypothetical protein